MNANKASAEVVWLRSYRRSFAFLCGPVVFCSFVVLCGCGRYADFTLPPLSGGDPSLTFTFEARAEPVLAPGSGEALNPSVIRREGLANYYSEFDGHTWRTALATSWDGLTWQRRRTVLEPDPQTWEGSYIAANGSALWWGGETWYWYQAGPRAGPQIGLFRAHKEAGPVVSRGPYMSWDERAVADPCVIRLEPYFYLYYLGQDRADPPRQRLGLARSKDGVHWEKLRSNPVLDLDGEAGLGEPAVWQLRGFYWMLYTARHADETRDLRLARSTDGVHWRKLPGAFAGAAAWDSQVMCDPAVLVEGDTVRVWFGGGDVARPDENIHGRIGYGILRPVRATLAP
jgi:Glycosyl hydrolases family 32 N-terminal domain